MYEDRLFPVDLRSVEKDHEFLDADSLQALFRRLHVLNECSRLNVVDHRKSQTPIDEDSDEEDEDQLPLSRRWKFIRKSRTWSRVVDDEFDPQNGADKNNHHHNFPASESLQTSQQLHSFPISLPITYVADSHLVNSTPPLRTSSTGLTKMDKCSSSKNATSYCEFRKPSTTSPSVGSKLQRSHSERIKDKAKALVKRMDYFRRTTASKTTSNNNANNCNNCFESVTDDFVCSHPRSLSPESSLRYLTDYKQQQRCTAAAAAEIRDLSPKLARTMNVPREFQRAPDSRLQPKHKYFCEPLLSSHVGSPTENVYVLPDFSKCDALKDRERSPLSLAGNNSTSDLNIIVDHLNQCVGVELAASSSSHQHHNQAPPLSTSSSDENENYFYWERRDSGVGSSLSRSPSVPVKPRVRWHSFQRRHHFRNRHIPNIQSQHYFDLPVDCLSLSQMINVQKYALLKLTALMEKYSVPSKSAVGGWQFGVQKLFKRMKSSDNKMIPDHRNTIFGVPLSTIAQRTGQPLPQCILHAMRFLRKQAADNVGLFRKSGVRSRIQQIRDRFESYSSELDEFDSQQVYDVADTVKQYFRDLPEPLLTAKLSETFVAIFLTVPEQLRVEALQKAILLLPDENREALQSLIYFLHDIASYSSSNRMNAQNLSVCFAPTLFQLSTRNMAMSPQRRRKTITGGVPNEKELGENRAAQSCLTVMIENCSIIFTVPKDIILRCSVNLIEHNDEPTNLNELGLPYGNYVTYLNGCIDALLKEHRERWRGWVIEGCVDSVEMSSKKVSDGHPLKLWRLWTDVEAPPKELLNRVLKERDSWDEDIVKWRVVQKLSDSCDIFQYVCNDMPPHPTRDYCVLRKWLVDMFEIKGGCILIETSVNVSEAPQIGGVRGVTLASRYLVEPSGAGRSRINHIIRVDTKGRGKNWYNKIFGHIFANHLARIRNSFRQISDGPETKV